MKSSKIGKGNTAHHSDRAKEEYDKWLDIEIQKAIDDSRPGIAHETVMSRVYAKLKGLSKTWGKGKA